MDELIETRLAVVQRLGRQQNTDYETGLHVIHMSHFSRLIALEAGLGEAWSDTLLNAAPMHDIGKIGIRTPFSRNLASWSQMNGHHATPRGNQGGDHRKTAGSAQHGAGSDRSTTRNGTAAATRKA